MITKDERELQTFEGCDASDPGGKLGEGRYRKYTARDGQLLWVNLAAIQGVKADGDGSVIIFSGGDKILIQEGLDQIFREGF